MRRCCRRGTGPPATLLADLAASVALGAALVGPARALDVPLLGGAISGYGIVALDRGSPRQLPQARIDLYAEQRIWWSLRWRASIIGLWGGPPAEDPRGAGLVNLDWSFQNFSPSLELDDAYVEYLGDSIDVRVGKQKFAWGRLDTTAPNDLLNPRRYDDPLLTDDNDAKIAVPALAASYYFPRAWQEHLPEAFRLTLVWQPIAVPWLFPVAAERWFPPVARTLGEVPVGSDVPGCPCTVDVTQQLRNSRPPARRFDNGNAALRFSGRSEPLDWAVVLFDGYDFAPSFNVPLTLDIAGATPGDNGPRIPALAELRPAYERFQSIGGDVAAAVSGFTVRAEAAWRFRRPYPFDVRKLGAVVEKNAQYVAELSNGDTVVVPAFAKRDAVEWGIGADRVIDGYLPLLEIYQVILLHNDQELLVRDVDTRVAAGVRKRFLDDRLEGELIFLWGIENGYEVIRNQWTYAVTDAFQVQVGILGIWGSMSSLLGEFNRNSELFARARFSF